MSTDYTHFTKLAFDQLFARRGPGEEVLVMDQDGNITLPGLSGTNTGDVTLTSVGSSPSSSAASLAGQVLTLQPADATHPGVLSTSAQSIAGAKTFTGAVTASNISGTNTGDQTITLTGGATGSGTSSFSVALANSAVLATVLTGYASSPGTVSATDNLLQAFQKLNGNNAAISSAVTSIGTFGSSPTANGASISANVLTLQPSDSTRPGHVSILAQDIGGVKNFATGFATPLVTNSSSGNLVSLTTNTGWINLTNASAKVVCGLVAPATAAGQIITVYNSGAGAMTIANQSGTETTAANRIVTSSGLDLYNVKSAILHYDTTNSRWNVVSYTFDGTTYVEQIVSTSTNFPAATSLYGTAATVTVPAGIWLVQAQVSAFLNATTATTLQAAISTSPSSGADHVAADNQLQGTFAAAGTTIYINWRRSYTAATPVYLKLSAVYPSGNPQYQCKLMATRVG